MRASGCVSARTRSSTRREILACSRRTTSVRDRTTRHPKRPVRPPQRQRCGLAAVILGENAIRLDRGEHRSSQSTHPHPGSLWPCCQDSWWSSDRPVPGPSTPVEAHGTSGIGALGAAAAAGFLAYAFMFGSPILLTSWQAEAPSDVSALFLVLTGVRMPFVVLQAVVPQLAVGARPCARPPAVRCRELAGSWRAVAVLGSSAAAAAGYFFGDLIIGIDLRHPRRDRANDLCTALGSLGPCGVRTDQHRRARRRGTLGDGSRWPGRSRRPPHPSLQRPE